ncbi:aspartate/glutamate racemase family protein [Devosia sediminis]|uniref:Aspartate/glutamate racemase family protein n=1 Tax=Devosia sediminis TaxID=2798801 RepID=A0A934ITD6_9HYPH|nr:aspartate/glutamate racemase family protein [Devosia sediminis]MBJ3786428.1 aspartate/glutamate racemase family protein [Devosia sediminis]
MKTIGLIGGMSWESSAHYYAAINRETARRLGGLHSAPLILHSVDFAPVAALQSEGRWEEAGQQLNAVARSLEAAGAQVLGLATNTMHVVAGVMLAGVDIPFVHIADPTAAALLADGFDTVGLLGTRFTMEMDFYKARLRERGLTVMVPEVDHTNLNGIIYDELCKGIVRDESREVYQAAIDRMAARGAQAVILGCTEIGMLIDDSTSSLPTYDTTQLHAEALVDAALG